jgi:hypothetical protein
MLSLKVPERCLLAQASLYVKSGKIPVPNDVFEAAPEFDFSGSKELIRALRAGLIAGDGELHEAFREGSWLTDRAWTRPRSFPPPDEVEIAARLWDFAKVVFESSELICSEPAIFVSYDLSSTLDFNTLVQAKEGRPGHSVETGFMFTGITLPTAKLFELFPSDSPEQIISPKAAGGRPPKYDWNGFFAEIIVRADLDELPATQAELVSQMAEWCLENWGEEPALSLLKSRTAAIFRHPRKSKRNSDKA